MAVTGHRKATAAEPGGAGFERDLMLNNNKEKRDHVSRMIGQGEREPAITASTTPLHDIVVEFQSTNVCACVSTCVCVCVFGRSLAPLHAQPLF